MMNAAIAASALDETLVVGSCDAANVPTLARSLGCGGSGGRAMWASLLGSGIALSLPTLYGMVFAEYFSRHAWQRRRLPGPPLV